MDNYSQAETNAIGAANLVAAVGAGAGGGVLGERLAKKAGAKAVGELAGDIGGNVGALALQLIVQGATGQLTGEVFGEDIKVLIIGEVLEKALTYLAGVSAGPLMVVQLVGAVLDTFWDPFKAYHQKDLDALHDMYQQSMKNELYTLRLKWPLIVTPEILPKDTEGNLAAPVLEQIRLYIRQYLDLKGLVTKEDIIERRMMSELSQFNDIRFVSSASGTLVGSIANLGLQADVLAAQMVVLYLKYRQARQKIAQNAIDRAEQKKWEAAKKYAGYASSVVCVICLVLCCFFAIRRLLS
jgi:hypothetical protein